VKNGDAETPAEGLRGLNPGYLVNFGEAVLKRRITGCVIGLEDEHILLERGEF